MHIFFSGIGGTAIGPLALIAHQAGYDVSGSDASDSTYIDYLKKHGISQIHIGQSKEAIAALNSKKPIDWFVYSSALPKTDPHHPELAFCEEENIKATKRDEFLNMLITDKKLWLIAIAGTHGKTTTTAMVVWLFKQLGEPVSYSVGTKLPFGQMGEFDPKSKYFVYEADEYDHNFLSFYPELAIISGVDWDHPDIYPTRETYMQAFTEFLDQSETAVLWQADAERLALEPATKFQILDSSDPDIDKLVKLAGRVNREDGWLAAHVLAKIAGSVSTNLEIINKFPGLDRRFEKIADNLFSDYAHTPAKIRGAIQMAFEVLDERSRSSGLDVAQGNNEQRASRTKTYGEQAAQADDAAMRQERQRVGGSAGKQSGATGAPGVVVIYEGLHNTRQHFIKDELDSLFNGVRQLYIVPSFLAREDPRLPLLSPADLLNLLSNTAKAHAEAAKLDKTLLEKIKNHLASGDLVLALSAGGSGSLDEWLRQNF